MGSQTLEILRQGVWASVTGGWFYDPHQDVFCNTFHLYIWLFLLCFPFTIYVYFPPTKYVWYFYCVFISIGFTLLKLLNYALHYMYDTSECFKEEAPEDPKRDDEGIEMQVLGKKNVQKEGVPRPHGSLASYIETGLRNSTDLDSLGSTEFQPLDAAAKPSSTIDLKAEVHRKNSSESSEEPLGVIELVSYRSESDKNHKTKRNDRRKHQRSKTDSFVNITYGNERQQRDSINRKRKRDPPVLIRGVDLHETSFHNRPSFQRSIEPDEKASKPQRRHSNFTNSSLNYLPSTSSGANIKQTGSLELTYIDKVPNNIIAGDGFYFENLRSGVRRIRSTALETCCSASSGLTVHPNSLEIIGCKSRNPLPPPSSTLIRNPHFNLCPYYGSEIVYPIAEQSDEHQTSHGPDTDIESLPRQSDSDSDFYENPKYPSRKQKPSRFSKIKKNSDKLSATSKDALLINSNSSEINQKNDFLDDTTLSENIKDNSLIIERTLSNISMDYDSKNCDNSDLKHKCENNNTSESVKPKNKKAKRKKSSESQSDMANCSSLVELDLDWLFDDSCHLTHRKEPLKRETDWSSTTSVSLEHDVSKVLQETVPVTRSLGAIPKKSRFTNSPNESSSSKTPKSESEKCAMCRCKSEKLQNSKEKLMNNKENKVTQTLLDEPSSPEGLECLVLPPKIQALNISKKYLKPIKTPEEASSSSSNNELSTLLPEIIPTSNPLLSAFLTSRRFEAPLAVCLPVSRECLEDFESSCSRSRLKRGRARRRPSRRNKRDSAIATSLSQGHGTHFAKNFNDTTDGALHCFQDEQGNWITYTFDEKGIGTANFRQPAVLEQISAEKNTTRRRLSAQNDSILRPNNKNIEIWDLTSTDSINTSAISVAQNENIRSNSDQNVTQTPIQNNNMLMNLSETVRRRILQENAGFEVVHLDTLSALDSNRRFAPIKTIQTTPELNNNLPKIKTYYKFKILPYSFVKISLDRLKLLALLDRNLSLFETLLASFLGILVSILGSIMLFQGFYEDFEAFLFCFVIASSQYSLLKSVQPDSASPIHGFNRVILYSRPVYFCLLTLLVLVLHSQVSLNVKEHSYGFDFDSQLVIFWVRNVLVKLILFFPLLFSLGLFPQVNTFLMFLLEHIDIHIFGGNAQQSLIGSFYCIFRSLLATLILIGFSYGGLSEAKSSQHILFSIFCSILVSSSYHLSRSSSDPSFFWATFKKHLWPPDLYKEHSDLKLDKSEIKNEKVVLNEKVDEQEKPKENQRAELVDPLPHKLQKTVNARLKNDIILCGLISIFVFVIHVSTVFTVLQPELSPVLWSIASIFGFIVHYIIPQLRKQLPWLCIARPVLKSSEFGHYQTRGAAKIMWFERVYVYLCFIERNILYPLVFLSALTEDAPKIVKNFGLPLGSLFVVISGLKCLRGSYSTQNCQYLILTFTALFLKFDYGIFHEEQTFLMEYFILSIVFYKLQELRLKVQFVVTYIAPWQITWGSAFHAFAQPFSVPHSAMLFLQAFISAILSTPLNPFLGSAIFLTSYVRPIKFWEKNYNTRRVDHSNTPLSSHLDRNLGSDDNNLNSIFYEHLTRSLQHSLCGDLILGRWGLVNQGDCFVLASDYLNCLVHVIEMGNGLVTFQMRGLEFRGTYCQQREVEAITEGVEENHGFCCCDFGHLPNMLSVNAAFSQRWLAWEVTASKYILEGYSISDNSAVSMFQVFEFRRILVSYYVKSIIFYTCRSPKLEEWLNSQTILKALVPMQDKTFVDLDPVFNYNIDEDFDGQSCGITKTSFWHIYGDWISFCATKCEKNVDSTSTSTLGLLCFALSLLGRRTLGAVSHNTVSSVEFFLYGLHALFKGDFRITCGRDEWIFTDMDLLKNVVAPGVRMSLKLHQDHFMSADEYEDLSALYDAISKHEQELVISHEGDPAWRNAVLSGTPSLLALRHVMDDGTDEYKIIMLNKRYLSFRVIKLNKECVRGLWAGQQQELIYLRNRNPERGSIQNAKQCLRNIINSSCDQPIGYPIYVSPLTTSYSDTNEQYCQLVGGSVSLKKIKNYIFDTFRRIRKRCGEGCSSGASTREEIQMGHEGIYAMTPVTTLGHHNTGSQSTEGSHLGGSIGRGSSLSRTSLGGNRGSMVSMGKPTSSTLASLAGLFKEKDERNISQTPDAPSRNDERLGEYSEFSPDNLQKVVIIEPGLVYDGINLGRRIDVYWPSEYMKIRGGRSYWNTWVPETGMEGFVVHKWTPGHRDPSKRSHVDRTILLVQIDDKFIPIAEQGVQGVSADL